MAYAVLVSLFNSTHKMLNPYPLIIPCNKQTIQSLHENIDSLMSFLENTPPHIYQTTKSLEANIRDVGYKAEDILEPYITKHSRSIYKFNKSGKFVETETEKDDETYENDENVIILSQSLVDVIRGFGSLMEQMKEIQSYVQMNSLSVAGSSSLASTSPSPSPSDTSSAKNKFVLVDKDMRNQITEQLFNGDKQLKVIPIVGMGGIGKTTLAKALIDDPSTSRHFDVRGWVTISQQYSIQDVEKLLKYMTGKDQKFAKLSDSKQQLHKYLFDRRYVVVLDDLWDTEACNELLNLFPECNKGSRIMVTTRQSRVATSATAEYCHEMKLLNDDTSWDLLRQVVFPKEGNNECPQELIKIGKEIAKKCNGLPLTISVIGGILSKEKIIPLQHWEQVAENMKSALTEAGDQCLEILSLSYNLLPHHLKACFLYFGIFPEDSMISVSIVLQLWIAEGFLKACSTNDMEKVAEENLKELIQRNLILVDEVEYNGNPKFLKVHDLLRDLCIREAGREKFLYVLKKQMDFNGEEASGHRRLSIVCSYTIREFDIVMQSMPGIRSLICLKFSRIRETITFGCELLRVIYIPYDEFEVELGESSNLRYLKYFLRSTKNANSTFKLWDLQYLLLSRQRNLPPYIWYMPQLRLVNVDNIKLPLPSTTESPICVLERLESLYTLSDFSFVDEVLVRIPNLRELKIFYRNKAKAGDWSYYHLDNLVKMTKLETLSCTFLSVSTETLLANLVFPLSLKNLSLKGCKISWEHMDFIGVLPNLEVLKLEEEAFVGKIWETSEDHFEKLEYLMIHSTFLMEWIVEDANHFPSLRYLHLKSCVYLEEIPTSIGEILTLETIKLDSSTKGVVTSAENMQDEDTNDFKLIIDGKTRYAYE